MTPAQAQIEAAELARWIKQLKWKSVDKDNMEFEVRTTCYVKDALDKWAALTAAQVGKPKYKTWEQADREDRNATIDRCAQVANDEPEAPGPMPDELYSVPLEDAIRAAIRATKKSIIARIRKLKDES